MRHRTNRTRWQQFQQRIIDWLLDLDPINVWFAVTAFLLVLLMCIVIFYGITQPTCAEGYVYMRGVCVQGYRP